MNFANIARIVGALAIGLSGLLHVMGDPQLANALMIIGTAAAVPESK